MRMVYFWDDIDHLMTSTIACCRSGNFASAVHEAALCYLWPACEAVSLPRDGHIPAGLLDRVVDLVLLGFLHTRKNGVILHKKIITPNFS